MARKSVHLELAGGKGPRQRVWERIRHLRGNAFELSEVTPGNVHLATARSYVLCLEKAGYLTAVGKTEAGKVTWKLVLNTGMEAPRVDKHGATVTQGGGNEALWGSMQTLGDFNALVLASVSGVAITSAKSYCQHLARAGYLTTVKAGRGTGKGGIPSTYRLLKSRNTGPRAPMVTRIKAVYDPNTHSFAWQQTPDDVAAELEVVK